jgi:FecR-like protein
MTESKHNQELDSETLERVLTEALSCEPLSDVAMQRLRDGALREWVSANRQPRRVRYIPNWAWAAAAALVCIAVGISALLRPGTPVETFGSVVRVDSGGNELADGWLHHHTVKAGSVLIGGDRLTCRGSALIALAVGGTLRVAADSVLTFSSATDLTLQRGRIYLDFPPDGSAAALGVKTWAGTIVHVGTQYEVLSDSQIVRIRVREGRVELRRESVRTVLDAGTQLTANRDGSLSTHEIPTYGGDWQWVASLAPDYEIEGQPLVRFLQWVARELGRPIEFADPHAREVAERTILHGSVKGRDPMEALVTVLSTTSLSYEIRGDTIWIQSSHDS